MDIDEEKIRHMLTPTNHLLEENRPYEQLSLFSALPPLDKKSIVTPDSITTSAQITSSGFLNTTTLLLEDASTALTGEL